MREFDKLENITREEIEDHLWARRANEYVLNDEKNIFRIDDDVKFKHRHQIFNKDLHDVDFKLNLMLNRSIACPVCQPQMQHDFGVDILEKYFKEKLGLADSEIQKNAIQTEDGHVFDFLIYDRLVVHYFDCSYFVNFVRETDEMKMLMAEFADSTDYDLLPIIYTDITSIIAGGELILTDNDEDE